LGKEVDAHAFNAKVLLEGMRFWWHSHPNTHPEEKGLTLLYERHLHRNDQDFLLFKDQCDRKQSLLDMRDSSSRSGFL
jgi:hypothetical protein